MKVALRRSRQLWLLSDLHIDNPRCDRDLIVSHLSAAKKNGAQVLFGGDVFDLMQLRNDPRRSFSGLKKEHAVDEYLDAVLEDAVSLLRPFAACIAGIATGNHEITAIRHAASDLIKRLCKELKCEPLPFRGWITLSDSNREWAMYYAHSGGSNNSPVTKGVIDVNRQLAFVDADIIWNGHTHTAYIMPFMRETKDGARLGYAIRTPSYVRSSASGSDYAALKGMSPNPVGCAVVELGDEISVQLKLSC